MCALVMDVGGEVVQEGEGEAVELNSCHNAFHFPWSGPTPNARFVLG